MRQSHHVIADYSVVLEHVTNAADKVGLDVNLEAERHLRIVRAGIEEQGNGVTGQLLCQYIADIHNAVQVV